MVKTAKSPASFEEAVAQREGLIRELESGELPLDGALAAYKQGSELLSFCQSRLTDAEQQLKVLENGVLRPLEPGND